MNEDKRPAPVSSRRHAPGSTPPSSAGKRTLIAADAENNPAPRTADAAPHGPGSGAHDRTESTVTARTRASSPPSPTRIPSTIQRAFGRPDASALRSNAPADVDAGGAAVRHDAVARTPNDAALLTAQAELATTDLEIPSLEGALLATRGDAKRAGLLSPTAYDAGLALSRAMTQLQPATAAHQPTSAIDRELAATAAMRLLGALQHDAGGDEHFRLAAPAGDGSVRTSENPYTGEARSTSSFLVWSSTVRFGSDFVRLPALIRGCEWPEAFAVYRRMTEALDRWVADQLRAHCKGGTGEAAGAAHEYRSQLRAGLEEIADQHASRLPAVFHPAVEVRQSDRAAGRSAVDAIPLQVYVWKGADDGRYRIRDLTTPTRPHMHVLDGPLTPAALATFFEDVARYPHGDVRFTLPGGAASVAPTSGKTKWYEWLGYAGLAIAAAGVAAITLGASVPATVCFAAGAIAGGVAAAGHLADSLRVGTASTATIVLDVAQIAASFTSFGAIGITWKAGTAAGALAGNRWFVPLVTAAAASDVVQLVALGDLTIDDRVEIRN